jgi:hypothetical protein
MGVYFWSIEDTEFATVDTPVVRFKNGYLPDEGSADIFNMTMGGDVVFRHGDLPVYTQSDTGVQNSGTTVTMTLPATATAGSLLVLAVLVDETPGTRTITLPSGYVTFGGNHLAGNMRLNTYLKISDGTETGQTITVSGSTQIIGWMGEYAGFEGYKLQDRELTDDGTGTTASVDYTTPDISEELELLLGVVGYHNTGTITSPTNGYAARDTATSTSMRLTIIEKVVTDGLTADPDFAVTLQNSDAWIARSITMTGQQTMMRIDAMAGDVFIRDAVMMRFEDVPGDPANNQVRIYLREDPLSLGNNELLAMFDDGNVVSLAKQTNGVAP